MKIKLLIFSLIFVFSNLFAQEVIEKDINLFSGDYTGVNWLIDAQDVEEESDNWWNDTISFSNTNQINFENDLPESKRIIFMESNLINVKSKLSIFKTLANQINYFSFINYMFFDQLSYYPDQNDNIKFMFNSLIKNIYYEGIKSFSDKFYEIPINQSLVEELQLNELVVCANTIYYLKNEQIETQNSFYSDFTHETIFYLVPIIIREDYNSPNYKVFVISETYLEVNNFYKFQYVFFNFCRTEDNKIMFLDYELNPDFNF